MQKDAQKWGDLNHRICCIKKVTVAFLQNSLTSQLKGSENQQEKTKPGLTAKIPKIIVPYTQLMSEGAAMPSSQTIELVIQTLLEVMQEQQKSPSSLKPDTRILADTSLDSLDLAIAVVKLEEKFGKDPFKNGFIPFSTVEELAKLYDL
ncbi:hypothetical protein [Parachlamydia sp. AcF125]|uniref:acyl carrier protein n=1 Tax=Parachlamydia sp. AcF125 TaxID=2795736 RepID=UPI001BD8002A|nr:hypothetical protein [Parachlamydia sp. AcF125]MBS4169082.1 hypothetical protein [Parachlamydia sp. AcF125]